MKEQVHHWKEGDAHKVGRMAIADGNTYVVINGRVLMQELHTNRLTFVDEIRLTEYLGDKTPVKPEART
jgi:hypothetical protein